MSNSVDVWSATEALVEAYLATWLGLSTQTDSIGAAKARTSTVSAW